MCGIAGGFWRGQSIDPRQAVRDALSLLQHRGPDDSGVFFEPLPNGSVCLGHQRLAILDLSTRGHQPMFLEDGRLGIVYNGEIYNYRELRQQLISEGWIFETGTDTEVLLKCWAAWGHSCLQKLEGMFAFAILDRESKKLICVRDAFGIKPLFFSSTADGVVFGSELPAVIALRRAKNEPDLQSAYAYLVHGEYDSHERTFVKGVKHLRPGMMMELHLETGHLAEPTSWWRPEFAIERKITFGDAAESLRERFLENIRVHLRSDVPVGAALSGGIDSSAVVCAIRHVAPDYPIRTFSYVADDSQLSEERWVDVVNASIDGIPHKVVATHSEFERDLECVIRAQGEPFGSTSIYAQYRVFHHARENGIVVTFDGQGADELLAGYDGFPGQRLLSLFERRDLSELWTFLSNWSRWPGRTRSGAVAHFSRLILSERLYALARKYTGHNNRPRWLALEEFERAGITLKERRPVRREAGRGRRVKEQLAHNLQVRGLPHLLRHGDRNAMAFSIESRVPFLTLSMAEFLLSLPESYLISDTGETKSVFRAAMRGIVPDSILDRKDKIGFATPEGQWFRQMGPTLRDWLEDADAISFLHRRALIHEFDAIIAGRRPFSWQLWRWINYIRWYRNVILN